jgi:AraC-like DNA-binding protein
MRSRTVQHASAAARVRAVDRARQRERRVAEIALEAGFSDISYFNRLFRARFGDTPTGIRGQR